MKLIEAMHKVKALVVKQDDLRKKIALYCAHTTIDTPMYGDRTAEQVKEWLQAHEDLSQEIARLKIAIQKTNLATPVTIELGDNHVTKTIAEWIIRRGGADKTGLASCDRQAWQALGDRNLREGQMKDSQNNLIEVKIVRNFDPFVRDKKISMYSEEPSRIDAALEVANAITDVSA